MTRILIVILLVGVILGTGVYFWSRKNQLKDTPKASSPPTSQLTINPKNMKITSSAFGNGENIPVKYTCDGEKINPPLQISEVPSEAKSLTLTVEDPDAPSGTYIHWTVWNIKPAASEIPENSVPQGAVQGTTSAGKPGFVGPCPPTGTHRYDFRLYALDTELELDSSAKIDGLKKAMEGHIIDNAELLGKYTR